MKSILLTLILIFTLLCSNLFMPIPGYAESNTGISIDGKSVIKITTGLAALYLINRISGFINNKNQSDLNNREVNSNSSSIRSISDLTDKIIVIDPGHGGYDPGAVGSGGLEEKDVTLDIAAKLNRLLSQNTGTKVYLTRTADRFVSLQERSALANRLNADIFISIHINAAEEGQEHGIETYAHHSASRKSWSLAWYLNDSLVRELSLQDRGLKSGNFQVIRETPDMESVLLEIGYISNQKEEGLLNNGGFREKAARAIYNGILNYYLAL